VGGSVDKEISSIPSERPDELLVAKVTISTDRRKTTPETDADDDDDDVVVDDEEEDDEDEEEDDEDEEEDVLAAELEPVTKLPNTDENSD